MARGYNTAGDVVPTTIDGVSLESIWAEFQNVNALFNRSSNSLAALFTARTTDAAEAIPLKLDGSEFELSSEFGSPEGLRAAPSFTRVGFPLKWFDLGIRYTRAFLRNATAAQVEAQHTEVLAADDRNQFRFILRAIFTKTSPGSRAQNENGVDVFSLYDGGADSAPAPYANKTFTAGHQHYSTTGSAVPDGLDVAFLIRQVTEHGFGSAPGEQVVVLVNAQEGEAIRGFRVGSTSPFDFIPSQSAPAYLSAESVIGDSVPGEFRGLPVAGGYGRALVIEHDYVPAGYMVAVAVSGTRAPLAFRQHPLTSQQGLQLLPGSVPGAKLYDASYERGFGVGVRHRGAAAVMQVTTNANYTNPTIA